MVTERGNQLVRGPVTFTDELRSYVLEYGTKAATAVLIACLEEHAAGNPRSEAGTLAGIDASVLKDAMKRMVR